MRRRTNGKNKNPQWLNLPEELWENILMRLSVMERVMIAQWVCATWWRMLNKPSMWHVIDMSNLCYDLLHEIDLFQKVCSHVVDRSQGELVDIRLSFNATKELLVYVAERSPKLKRLTIAWCNKLVHNDLVEVVKKLPMLEELSLAYTGITREGIEALGCSCPRLKSFEWKHFLSCCMQSGDERNDQALAISKSLSTLRHLQLISDSMTNEGLEAILDGCPNLESLDLRGCLNVSLNKVLRSRISQQIKDVKYPHDSSVGLF